MNWFPVDFVLTGIAAAVVSVLVPKNGRRSGSD